MCGNSSEWQCYYIKDRCKASHPWRNEAICGGRVNEVTDLVQRESFSKCVSKRREKLRSGFVLNDENKRTKYHEIHQTTKKNHLFTSTEGTSQCRDCFDTEEGEPCSRTQSDSRRQLSGYRSWWRVYYIAAVGTRRLLTSTDTSACCKTRKSSAV